MSKKVFSVVTNDGSEAAVVVNFPDSEKPLLSVQVGRAGDSKPGVEMSLEQAQAVHLLFIGLDNREVFLAAIKKMEDQSD